jgi:hypothetical protein
LDTAELAGTLNDFERFETEVLHWSSAASDWVAGGCPLLARGTPVSVRVQAPLAPVTPLICELVCDDLLAPNTVTVRATATMVVW